MRQKKVQRPSGSLLEGERAYRILYTDQYQDPRIRESHALANLMKRLLANARTDTTGKNDLKNARSAKLLEQIAKAESRTEIRRRIDTARSAEERARNRSAEKPKTDNGQRKDDRRKPTPVLPSPPNLPQLPTTPDQPELPSPPVFPPFPPIPQLEPVPMLPAPGQPKPRKRDKNEDDPSCQELAQIARAAGLPEPVCERSGKGVRIRGGKNI